MAIFDFNDALKKVGQSAKEVAEKASIVAQVGAELIGDAAKEGADKLSESVKNAAEQKKIDDAKKAEEKKLAAERAAVAASKIVAMPPEKALMIFYYLMAADGTVSDEEMERFNLLGQELDKDFATHKDKAVEACKRQLAGAEGDDKRAQLIKAGLDKLMAATPQVLEGYIPARLLIWDLLTIACCDNDYSHAEQRIVEQVAKAMEVSKDIVLEMENSMLTICDIEKEIAWLKLSDRSYVEIEKQVKELEKRIEDITFSAKALIVL